MLDQYCKLKQLKEQERQIQRDQKKVQGQLIAEQEAMYGSKPSPSKNLRPSIGRVVNKRGSLGGAALQSTLDKATLSSQKNKTVKRQTSNNHYHTSLTAHSTGKKSMANGPAKLHSSNASISQHTGSSALRKALSPLSSLCSNVISCNHQGQNTKNAELLDTQTGYKTPAAAKTPTKRYSGNDENRTPNAMPIPVPATPSTASSPMLAAKIPVTPGVRATEEVEYSYEERRAGFVAPKVLTRTLSLN